MPKHTIYSTNNRLRCRNFQSYNFWEYLTDWRNTGLLQTKEDKNGRTLAGCGVWRTAQKEIAAAAGYLGEKRFKIRMDEKHTAFVVLELQMFNRPFPAFVWSVEVRSKYGPVYTKHNILAVDRKRWREICETDARQILYSVMMPPGVWLAYQLESGDSKEKIMSDRLTGKSPLIDKTDYRKQINKACRRNAEYMRRREEHAVQRYLQSRTLSLF